MTQTKKTRTGNRGKWVAATLVLLAIAAALAEWKWRPPVSDPNVIAPVAPASSSQSSD